MKKKIINIYIVLILVMLILTPIKVSASSITLHKSSLEIGPNYSEMIGYTLSDNLNSSNIQWSSSNSNIITVNNGVITAVANEGSAIITATIDGYSSTCKVTITSNYIPVNDIKINKSTLNILIGTTDTLITTISPNNATNKDVIWHSSDQNVATVNSSGVITAKKIGTTIITATSSNGTKTTCRVTVVDTISLKDINFSTTSLTIKEKSSENLSINFNPSNATNKKVTWRSSNPQIVTVDSNGKITGVKPGTATITSVSNDGGYVATCKIIVEEISKKVTKITLNKEKLNIIAGESEQLTTIIEPDYAENKTVIWISSNENIAKVENGLVTGLSAGTTDIKAVSEDGDIEAVCKVTITTPPLKAISFIEEEQTVFLGETTNLNYITEPTYSVISNAIWTSSNENIATVTDGIITPISVGETVITISNEDKTISASTKIIVTEKPKEKINITIEGYELNFDESKKNYTIKIKDEDSLIINTNIDKDKLRINGNQNLKNGSIITISIVDQETITYIINIKKTNYTIYFIIVIVILLIINLFRIIKNQKKTKVS